MNVRDNTEWRKNDSGRRIYKWDAYRIEMRYILVDKPEEQSRELKYQAKQHGPILIEKTEQSMRQDDRTHQPQRILPNTSVKQ